MWSAIFALLQTIPALAWILEKLTPTHRDRQIDRTRKDKQHEREKIDAWVDRDGTPPV